LPSEDGQKCRTIVQKAMDMKNPCIQITPVFPNTLDEWAKLYFFIKKMTDEIQNKIELPFLVNIEETGKRNGTQCHINKNGYHEMIIVENESLKHNTVMCIHCGSISPMSTKTKEEVKNYFKQRKFNNDKVIEQTEDLPY
jgi:hypothetical protein